MTIIQINTSVGEHCKRPDYKHDISKKIDNKKLKNLPTSLKSLKEEQISFRNVVNEFRNFRSVHRNA